MSTSSGGSLRNELALQKSSVFFTKTSCDKHSFGHGCTRTAVPRSSQPSTLLGTVRWVSAFGLIQLDLESGTICRRNSDSRTCHTAVSDIVADNIFILSVETTRGVNTRLNPALEMLLLTYLLEWNLLPDSLRDSARCTNSSRHWRIQRGRVRGVQTPHWIFRIIVNCVFAKYTVQALLLYPLNPKFSTGKQTLYTNFTFCFSFWGTSIPKTSWPGPHHVNPLRCKILVTPMASDRLWRLIFFAAQ